MSKAPTVLFFTCATRFYQNFVIPYVYFAKKHNYFSNFEFIIDDLGSFKEKHEKSILWLKREYEVDIVLRSVSELAVRPKMENSIRFIMEPKTISDYVYIGDVDIMILEDVFQWHKPIFDAGLPYSNMVREGTNRLTGLHFVRRDAYYPLPEIGDLIGSIHNDESLLYAICERKGVLYNNEQYFSIRKGRPIHGIHLSLNRLPFSYHKERVSWGMTYSWLEVVDKICQSSEFKDFYSTCHPGSAEILRNFIYLSRGVCSLGEGYWKWSSSK